MRRFLLLITLALCGLVAGGCVDGAFYHPDRVAYHTPVQLGLNVDDVTFYSRDHTQLHGWFIPARGGARGAVGTVIHCHGNGENITGWVKSVSWLPEAGFNVFMFDYRGYGESAGEPDHEGVFQDTVAAIRYAALRPDVNPDKLIVFGQSLGASLAIAAVGEKPVPHIQAVVADSTFSSYRQIVRDTMARMTVISWFRWPLSFLIASNSHSPDADVGQLPPATALLLIHGTDDAVIPVDHSQELYKLAHEPKALWVIDGGYHCDAMFREDGRYRTMLAAYLRRTLGEP